MAKLTRDLSRAKALRPRDIFDIYGVHPSMISRACNSKDADKFLPSVLIHGRNGHLGQRYIEIADFEAWWAKRKTRLVASLVASPSQNAA